SQSSPANLRAGKGYPRAGCSCSDYLSIHSGILLALGNLLAQTIEKKRKKENSENLDVSGPLRYAIYGFFFTGPLSHFFYLFMESWIPSEVPLAGIKRLLLDRLLFAPAFLLLFFLIMNFLEVGVCHSTYYSSSFSTVILSLTCRGRIQRVCELFTTLKLKFSEDAETQSG
ncbi:PREDICTED: peroxisomal membrane protein 2-like, partial [Galeopterus variegatus]|uniref:Peroxisomal membrane protein 2-like n=1 Tax=Galeopterus variegatus TaxID=482537 RepID=A0ABM0Q7T7_GALVR